MDNKFILQIVFSDGTSVHYVLDKCFLVKHTGRFPLDDFKYSLRYIPEIILSKELVSQIVDYHYWSIGNGIEY